MRSQYIFIVTLLCFYFSNSIADSVQFYFDDSIPALCSSNRKFSRAINEYNSLLTGDGSSISEDLSRWDELLDEDFKYTYNGNTLAQSKQEFSSFITLSLAIVRNSAVEPQEFFVNGRNALQTGRRTVNLLGKNGRVLPASTSVTFSQLFTFDDLGKITSLQQIEDASQITFMTTSQ